MRYITTPEEIDQGRTVTRVHLSQKWLPQLPPPDYQTIVVTRILVGDLPQRDAAVRAGGAQLRPEITREWKVSWPSDAQVDVYEAGM